jgi:sulfite exporter TauE/SafE
VFDSQLSILLAYNTGRIASYATAGAILGLLSAGAFQLTAQHQALSIARIVTGIFTIGLGLYVSGWWPQFGVLEKLGEKLWTIIEPFGRHFLPADRPSKALFFGMIWGWLPCGLVYTALVWSLTSGSATKGAALMAGFGLGTLPAMFMTGLAARWFAEVGRKLWVRRLAGLLLMGLGLYLLLSHSAHVH